MARDLDHGGRGRWVLLILTACGLCLFQPTSAWAQRAALTELYGRGVHDYFAGRTADAQAKFNAVIDGGAADPRVYYFRGLTHLLMGQNVAADDDFRRAAQLEYSGKGRAVNVGRALERVQGYERLELEKVRREERLAVATGGAIAPHTGVGPGREATPDSSFPVAPATSVQSIKPTPSTDSFPEVPFDPGNAATGSLDTAEAERGAPAAQPEPAPSSEGGIGNWLRNAVDAVLPGKSAADATLDQSVSEPAEEGIGGDEAAEIAPGFDDAAKEAFPDPFDAATPADAQPVEEEDESSFDEFFDALPTADGEMPVDATEVTPDPAESFGQPEADAPNQADAVEAESAAPDLGAESFEDAVDTPAEVAPEANPAPPVEEAMPEFDAEADIAETPFDAALDSAPAADGSGEEAGSLDNLFADDEASPPADNSTAPAEDASPDDLFSTE